MFNKAPEFLKRRRDESKTLTILREKLKGEGGGASHIWPCKAGGLVKKSEKSETLSRIPSLGAKEGRQAERGGPNGGLVRCPYDSAEKENSRIRS